MARRCLALISLKHWSLHRLADVWRAQAERMLGQRQFKAHQRGVAELAATVAINVATNATHVGIGILHVILWCHASSFRLKAFLREVLRLDLCHIGKRLWSLSGLILNVWASMTFRARWLWTYADHFEIFLFDRLDDLHLVLRFVQRSAHVN